MLNQLISYLIEEAILLFPDFVISLIVSGLTLHLIISLQMSLLIDFVM
jgi:hypothetical protein